MSWKCACKEENNSNETRTCKNCGRSRPKYLGIKLDLSPTDKMTEEQKGVWYLMIAYHHLSESNEYLKLEKDLSEKSKDPDYNKTLIEEKIRGIRQKAEDNCSKCLNLVEKAAQFSPNAQFKGEEGIV